MTELLDNAVWSRIEALLLDPSIIRAELARLTEDDRTDADLAAVDHEPDFMLLLEQMPMGLEHPGRAAHRAPWGGSSAAVYDTASTHVCEVARI